MRSIGEAAKEMGLPTHVLRFWEGKFSQLKPVKRRGGARFYRPNDMQILQHIKRLLHDEGYTIKGAKRWLKEHKDQLDMPVDALKSATSTETAPEATTAQPQEKDGQITLFEAIDHQEKSDAKQVLRHAKSRLEALLDRLSQ